MALHGSRARNIGLLDRWVEIYKRTEQETEFGFQHVDVLVAETWAEEIPKTRTMREEIMGGKESSIQETHWRVRYEIEAATSYWVKFEDYLYDIITILPEGRDYKILVTQLRENLQYGGVNG